MALRALPERAMRSGAGLAARVTRIVTCFSLLWLKANRKSDCCWEWGRKIHFHPENWAQPVPTSAPLAGAQPGSAVACKHGVVMALLPCWGLFGIPRGQGAGTEPPHTLQGLGQGGGSAARKQARAWSLPHHAQGSQPGPAAPAEAVKGAELPALPLGLRGPQGAAAARAVLLGLGGGRGRSAFVPPVAPGG